MPDNWFDVWYPELALNAKLMSKGRLSGTNLGRSFKAEIRAPFPARTLDLLAAPLA